MIFVFLNSFNHTTHLFDETWNCSNHALVVILTKYFLQCMLLFFLAEISIHWLEHSDLKPPIIASWKVLVCEFALAVIVVIVCVNILGECRILWGEHAYQIMHYSMHELSDHSTQLDRSGIPYSGKLSKEKTFANWWFSLRKLSRIARICYAKGRHAPSFARRNREFRECFLSRRFSTIW